MTAKNDFLSLLLKAHSHLTQSDLETKWASAFQQRVMISLRGGGLVYSLETAISSKANCSNRVVVEVLHSSND